MKTFILLDREVFEDFIWNSRLHLRCSLHLCKKGASGRCVPCAMLHVTNDNNENCVMDKDKLQAAAPNYTQVEREYIRMIM